LAKELFGFGQRNPMGLQDSIMQQQQNSNMTFQTVNKTATPIQHIGITT